MAIRSLLLVVLVSVCTAVPLEENGKARYDNYRVYRIFATNNEEIKFLQTLEKEEIGYSFWTSASQAGKPVDIMVPPHKLPEAISIFNSLNLKYHQMIDDVQRVIDEEHSPYPRASAGIDWSNYNRLDDIYSWLDDLTTQYPDKVTTVIGGQSYENRQIKGVKYSTGGTGKRVIIVDGGIHAREWISPAVTTYMLNEVVTSQDANVRALVDSFDWYFFPVINPDGYEYTFTTDRMWRKTRSQTSLPFCVGADANRNWGYHWNEGGASNNPCSDIYAGSGPFSEVETKTFSDFITTVVKDCDIYLSLHSYSQLMLFPMGYTSAHLPDYAHLMTVGNKAADALKKVHGTSYSVGNIVETLYVASGGDIDWVKGVYNTSLTYVFELRDQGKYGFILPASEIIPSGEETFKALVSLAEDAKSMRNKKH